MTHATIQASSVADLTREYQARLTEAARREFSNAQLAAAYHEYQLNEGQLEDGTVRTNVRHFIEWLDRHGLHVLSVGREEAQAFVKWLPTGDYPGRRKQTPLKAGAVLAHIRVASGLFNFLVDVRRLAMGNPFADVQRGFKRRHKSELRPDLRAVYENDVAMLLAAAEDLDSFTLELFLFKTGARITEALSVRMDQINWQERTISVDPHPKRTWPKLYFDEETEYFLRLKCEKNKREYPGNPYLWPSRKNRMGHLTDDTARKMLNRLLHASPLGATVTGQESNITPHTRRRGFTSVLKRNGCPSHIVAVLRGDSLIARSELTPDPTQGIYTKFGKVGGRPELRYWFEKTMPHVGAREIWERAMPTRASAQDVRGLVRAVAAGAVG
jgi:integrase